jgi:acetyltransferase
MGLSGFVSVGNKSDVDFGDLIDYFEHDTDTKAICLYVESLKDGRKFLEATEDCKKPIIILKSGRTESGKKAASSHTAALATEDKIYDGVFKQYGIIRVETLYQLFEIARYFVHRNAPKRNRGIIITNAGGPGVLASDAFEREGMEIADIAGVKKELDSILPVHWSHNNPIDIVGDARPERYKKVFDIIEGKKFYDFVLCILTPQTMTEPEKVAQIFSGFAKRTGIPCFGCFMGGELIDSAKKTLRKNKIINFVEPDYAAHVISKMVIK